MLINMPTKLSDALSGSSDRLNYVFDAIQTIVQVSSFTFKRSSTGGETDSFATIAASRRDKKCAARYDFNSALTNRCTAVTAMHPSWRERQYQPRAAWTAIAAADPDPLYLKSLESVSPTQGVAQV